VKSLILLLISVLMFSCSKETDNIVDTKTLNQDIVTTVSYGFAPSGTFIPPMMQSVTFIGYDNSDNINISFNGVSNFEFEQNLTNFSYQAENYITCNQQAAFEINVNGQNSTFTEIMPDTVFFTSHNTRDTIHVGHDVSLEWNQIENKNYFYLRIYVSNLQTLERIDTSIITNENKFVIPAKYFVEDELTRIYLYAVNGPKPENNVPTSSSDGLNIKYYYYTFTTISLEGVISTSNKNIPYSVEEYITDDPFMHLLGL
jgi:hypothetical protein